MSRAYSSGIFAIAICVLLNGPAPCHSQDSKSRIDAVKAVLSEFDRQKELVRKQEELLKQNAQDFTEIEAEMTKNFNASEMTMFARAVAQVTRDANIPQAGANATLDQAANQAASSIDAIRANLELMQLSSAQMALANKRIECMQSAVQLTETRNNLMNGLQQFHEKLWEFADVSYTFSEEEDRAILGAFNSVKNEDTPAVLIRGLLRLRVGELDIAKDDFDLVVSQNAPCSPIALAARGRVMELQKATKKSRTDFAMAKKFGDDNYFVQWLLGNFAAANGDWKIAENFFEKALKAKKFEQPLHRSLALALYERNKSRRASMKECLEHAEVASKLGTGKDWLAEAVYAAALNEAGDTASAQIHIDNALAACPPKAKDGCDNIASAIKNKSRADTSVFWKN
jgi:hypothetical protein